MADDKHEKRGDVNPADDPGKIETERVTRGDEGISHDDPGPIPHRPVEEADREGDG
jgi:hypothetical protein